MPVPLALFSLFFASLLQTAPRQLAIVNSNLYQFEDGPRVPPGYSFVPGETAFLTFQVRGYRVSKEDRILLAHEIEALDARGIRLMETARGKISAELAPEDKGWLPGVRQGIPIPPLADSGAYRILVSVKDELSGQEAKLEIHFEVRGREVEPSQTLVIRNFRFLRGEQDREPLAVPVYRPGDRMWARFEITGYRIGEKNLIHVEYDVSVIGPTGKILFSQPQAAAEKTAPFYPHRYLPGLLSLNLEPNVDRAEYTLLVALRDEVGKQTYEARERFRVE